MTEKSGLEMIEDIRNDVKLLGKRIEIMEQLMKELLNRANGFATPSAPSISATSAQPKPTIASTTPLPQNIGDEPGTSTIQAHDVGKAKPNKTKVLGRIKNTEGQLISGVNVKIYNHDKVVKDTKTNRAGEWMCFLPPGNYKAEYHLKDIVNTNVSFNVEPGAGVLRVAQPQM